MKVFARNIFRAGPAGVARFVEASLFLTSAAALVRMIPFRYYAPLLGDRKGADRSVSNAVFDATRLWPIVEAARRAQRYLPFECKCLVKTIAFRMMLGIRGIPSTAHLGVAKDPAGNLTAHAWLKVGSIFITGGDASAAYFEIVRFSSPGRELHSKAG